MPRLGYYSLTIKEGAARRFIELAAKSNVNIVDLFDALAEKLPDLDLKELLSLLEKSKLIEIHEDLTAGVVKLRLSTLYYRLENLYESLCSLFPSPYFIKNWEDYVHPYYALCATEIINKDSDVLQLIRDLENVMGEIKRILNKNFPDWEQEIKPPAFSPGPAPIPKELLKPEVFMRNEARERLRNELQHWVASMEAVILSCEEAINDLSRYYPQVDALCESVIKQIKILFKIP